MCPNYLPDTFSPSLGIHDVCLDVCGVIYLVDSKFRCKTERICVDGHELLSHKCLAMTDVQKYVI